MKLTNNGLLFIWMILFWLMVYHAGIVKIEEEDVIINFLQLIFLSLVAFNVFPFIFIAIDCLKGERQVIKRKFIGYRLLYIVLGILGFLIVSKIPKFCIISLD
jgi:hypothetical protein